MRYVNFTPSPTYCSATQSQINPGRRSGSQPALVDFLNSLVRGSGRCSIVLEKADMDALNRFLNKTKGPSDEIMSRIRQYWDDPSGTRRKSEETDRMYAARQHALSEMMKENAQREARINSESNFILPDGRTVPKEDESAISGAHVAKGAPVVEPRIVDNPMSALDILSHNAKVSTERAQVRPLSGKEAVAARKGPPGMPNLPGVDKILDTLAMEAKSAGLASSGRGFPAFSTADIMAQAENRNYNRKP